MNRLFSVVLALAVFAPAIASAAKQNLRFGKLEFQPYFKMSETYDSNIYMVPDDLNGFQTGGGVRGAWIAEKKLSLNFRLPVSAIHSFKGGYEFQALTYSTMSKTNDSYNQSANLGYSYSGPTGFSGGLGDTYVNTTDPAFSESAAREHRWQNTVAAQGEYAPKNGPLFFGADFNHTVNKYVGFTVGRLLNRYDQTFGVKVGYKIQPKTRVLAAWHANVTHYADGANTRNSMSHLVDFAIEGRLAPKLEGRVQTGMSLRNYDNNSSSTTYSQNWTFGAQLTYKLLERATAILSARRNLQESIFENNRFYISNSFNLNYRHALPLRLTATVDLGMTIDKFSERTRFRPTGGTTFMEGNRRDDMYQQKVGLDYALVEYLSIGASYLHRQKFSIFSGQYNYNDHQASLNAMLTF